MTTTRMNSKTPMLAACRGLLALLALAGLLLLGGTVQAQTLRLQRLQTSTGSKESVARPCSLKTQ